MSAIKKVVGGVVHAVKGVVTGAVGFVKKYWKPILMAAAIVFTAGIATVGVAGFSSAMAAGGGGFGGFMAAAGSTMTAGVASIGGSLGIGSGVTASTAGGAFANAGIMSGLAPGAGLTLGSGAAAQGLGLAASTVAPAQGLGLASSAIGQSGLAAGATGATSGGYGAGGFLTAANPAPGLMGTAGASGGSVLSGAGAAATNGIASNVAGAATQGAAKQGVLSTILNSRAAGPLLSAGIQGLSGYAQGQQQQYLYNQTKPLSYWGVGARGQSNGGGAIASPYGPNETLTGQPGTQGTTATPTASGVPVAVGYNAGAAGSPYAYDPRTAFTNGTPGLMSLGNNINAPFDPNATYPYGYH